MPRLDSTARVRHHIEQVLAEGPCAFEDLRDELLERGVELGPDPDERLDDVLESVPFVSSVHVVDDDDPDGHVDLLVHRVALIDGITWTVPITDVDLASDTLPVVSLGLLVLPLLNGWCSLDGGDLVTFDSERRRDRAEEDLGAECQVGLAFPPGWLAAQGARAGGFLLLRVEGEVVRAEAADEAPLPSPVLVDALVVTFESDCEGRASQSANELLMALFARWADRRAVLLPPINAWLAAAGLVCEGSFVARAGFDFERDHLRRLVEDTADVYGFSSKDTEAYATVVAARKAWRKDPGGVAADQLAAAARALGHLPVANAFAEHECDPDDVGDHQDLVAFGEALVDAASGRHRAGAAWLVASAHGVCGRTDQFEAWIDRALAFDGDHPLSLYDKAWFEFDRGEARKAKALLTRLPAGLVEHDVRILDDVSAVGRPAVGRNDPCPCGSGRKFKQCHLGVDETPLDKRLTWLYRKANWWLARWHRGEVDAAAWVRSQGTDQSPEQLLAEDPSVVDAVLAEGGRFAEWLAHRGALLPADEALLAGQWALVERSVFEVTDVRRDEGMTLRDLRTGEIVEVRERAGTQGMSVGEYILVRPLPTGSGEHQFFGGITLVPDHARDRVIEVLDQGPTPAALLAVVAEAEGPPSLSNHDGDAIVVCETTWRLPAVAPAIVALDAVFARSDDDASDGKAGWTWLAQDAGDEAGGAATGGRTVLGNLTLDGDRLTAVTNSESRAAQVRSIVEGEIPGATMVEDLRTDLDEIRNDKAYERFVFDDHDAAPSAGLDLDALPPEMHAAVRAQIDAYEVRWVDESIPALGGATPREALDDPTRRDDLVRLLDRMEAMEANLASGERALGMRTSRLRELLGLQPKGDLRLPGR